MDELLMRSTVILYLNLQTDWVMFSYIAVLHVYGFIAMLWQHE